MPLPGLLKSKAFWAFSTVTGTVSSCVAYDRYQSHLLRTHYLQQASEYGRQPLPHHQSPRCLSIFLLARDAAHHKALREMFKDFGLEILTEAGVDYRWVVEVDGEEAGRLWDEGAREGNKPELMLEENKKVIGVDELNEHALEIALSDKSGIKQTSSTSSADPTDFLWQRIRYKSCSALDWPPTSDGFLAIDPFTYTSLQSKLQQLKELQELPAEAPSPVKKKSWFWSKSNHTQTTATQSIFPVPIYFVPCDYPQTALSRLNRFLFGQRHLTRSIGDSLLALIREQPTVLITAKQQQQ